jgi:hypothetical protein
MVKSGDTENREKAQSFTEEMRFILLFFSVNLCGFSVALRVPSLKRGR